MPKPTLPAFDPADLAESNATSYPEKFRAANSGRWNRRLGDHVGLTNFGVNLTRIVPGAQSSARHAHSRQDEFIWVFIPDPPPPGAGFVPRSEPPDPAPVGNAVGDLGWIDGEVRPLDRDGARWRLGDDRRVGRDAAELAVRR